MRGRKKAKEDAPIEPKRVVKRRPRSGTRRCVNLALCVDHAMRLEIRAVRGLTTVSEIVMDMIDAAGRRGGGDVAADEPAEDAA